MGCLDPTSPQPFHIRKTFIERIEDLEVDAGEPRRVKSCPQLGKPDVSSDEDDISDREFVQSPLGSESQLQSSELQSPCTSAFDRSEDSSVEDKDALQLGHLKRFRTFDWFEDWNVEEEDSDHVPLAYSLPQLPQKQVNFSGTGNSPRNAFADNPSLTTSLNSSDNVHALSGRSCSDENGGHKASAIGVHSTDTFAGCSKREQVVTAGASSNQKDALRCTTAHESGVGCVEWSVDAKRLSSTDRQLVSPAFELGSEASKRLQLKLILHPCRSKTGRGNASLRHAGGIGSLSLKSDEANFQGSEPRRVTYRILVGDIWTKWWSHDFMKAALLRCEGEWNFIKAVDKDTKQAKVRLEITTDDLCECSVIRAQSTTI